MLSDAAPDFPRAFISQYAGAIVPLPEANARR